ncbi:hypothetical protein FE633_25825 [Streptomyces montanus]|uniref:Uncharacterized protein n=1 Tax=Streptomyces montanus TaxID=2580423 RepID=A0A5R9FJE9_9ACTN|nr:hypothetical protein [Streptomyces montanus]TLS43371.1 hypothetical protein FE633_25825 [Streptomyces montanus]
MRVGITGHRGLPEAIALPVREQLATHIEGYAVASHGDLVVVTCLADGPDTWCAYEALAHAGSIEAVIPAEDYRSVLPTRHHADFDHLLSHASTVRRTGLATSDGHAFMVAGELMLDDIDALLAVWDGLPAHGYGGTADVVAEAGKRGIPVNRVWPVGTVRPPSSAPVS